MAYRERLLERQRTTGRPVRVGLVGAGQMGRGFVAQVRRISGMEVAAVADLDLERATGALRAAGVEQVTTGDDLDTLSAVVADGGTVAVTDHTLAAALPLDMVIDATGIPEIGAEVALRCLLAGRHVGLLNVETDVTVGWMLSRIAAQSGAVYTLCRGDEPAETLKLVEFARDLAFEIVCAGKGKNNPLNPHATPADLVEEARRKRMNPKMLASFVDGSKAMIEMAALANAADLGVGPSGLSGHRTTVPELHEVFRPAADGGILDEAGVVDMATGPVAPGVFVVARSDEPTVVEEMDYLGMGAGPYYSFYRPYHLASIEAPLSIPAAVLDGRSDIQPRAWRAEVAAGAKRDLRAGEVIDGIGGDRVYGVIASAEQVKADHLVPLGLLAGARLTRDVRQDEVITQDDVEIDTTTTIAQLRALQDRLLDGHPVPAAGIGHVPAA
ncbi:MAG TPA: SAF domain-containing protein [Pseudonocardia sp.]|uniref:NAD(P)H-dependent oxidoreductase n=1 Tax=Pseudonocardia sp. TaxID=60912 RepID=UPI002B4B1D7E|nr:SAF domain-containing protein [Pseudonocardia sp.]HLU60114.1 SAF domain-containing protein [Pseudonocardia sp.]